MRAPLLQRPTPPLTSTPRLSAEKKGGTDIVPVFVTLDPHRDSCAQVGAYVKDFHPRMVALTGTPAQVAKAAKRFRVYFAEVDRNEGDDDYLGEGGGWGGVGERLPLTLPLEARMTHCVYFTTHPTWPNPPRCSGPLHRHVPHGAGGPVHRLLHAAAHGA